MASAKIVVNINSATIEKFSREEVGRSVWETERWSDRFRSCAENQLRVHQVNTSSNTQAVRITSMSGVPVNVGMRVTIVDRLDRGAGLNRPKPLSEATPAGNRANGSSADGAATCVERSRHNCRTAFSTCQRGASTSRPGSKNLVSQSTLPPGSNRFAVETVRSVVGGIPSGTFTSQTAQPDRPPRRPAGRKIASPGRHGSFHARPAGKTQDHCEGEPCSTTTQGWG